MESMVCYSHSRAFHHLTPPKGILMPYENIFFEKQENVL